LDSNLFRPFAQPCAMHSTSRASVRRCLVRGNPAQAVETKCSKPGTHDLPA
jgi:hypothetical protein